MRLYIMIGLLLGGTFVSSAEVAKKTEFNFSEHIAPIIFNNCTTCHRKGEAAPFAFMNYNDVRKRGKLIAEVTKRKFMPPWHAESVDYKFQGERGLTDKQISMLGKWVESGMAEGDKEKLPTLPKFTAGWQLGKPDLVVKMIEPYPVPAEGRDIYRSFVIPLGIKQDKWVKAVEFKPGEPSVVHHSLFRYDNTGRARSLDARSSIPGFSGMGNGDALGPRSLGGWAVGGGARFLPEGLAYRLPKGSDLILDMHFHLSGKPEKEVSTVGIYFTDEPPTSSFSAIQMPPKFGALSRVDIPAGEKEYTVKDSFVVPIDVEAFAISSHAHYLGKELKMTATFPDGKTKELLWIKDWDFSWQEQYNYTDMISVPKGTRLDATVLWDNSSDNPNNPSSPPRRVRWGLQSTDEMGSMTLMVKPKRSRDLGALRSAMAQHAREHSASRAIRENAGLGQRLIDSAMQGDRDKDGKITQKEAPRWLLRIFSRIDTNGDDAIDKKELEQGISRLRGGGRK